MKETKELVVTPQAQVQLFGTSEPGGVIAKARAIANELVPIVDACKLYEMIPSKTGSRKFVKAEGWTTMVAMLGVFPQVEYARMISDNPLAYEARILLKTIDGKTVGAGEAICSAAERNWANRDEYAIKSMAQTRAVGKACRLSFSWIMALAGYEVMPAEEITPEMRGEAKSERSAPMPTATVVDAEMHEDNSEPTDGTPEVISKKQQGLIWYRLHVKFGQGKDADVNCSVWLKTKLQIDFGNRTIDQLTWKDMDPLLKAIEKIKVNAEG